MEEKSIVIIDYHLGNIKSIQHALNYLGYKIKISNCREEIRKSTGIILPGVGAFRDAIKILRERELDKLIKDEIKNGKPFLGICLGMQLLFSYSEENGFYQGLGIIPGKVVRFSIQSRVPHLGWNQVNYYFKEESKASCLFSGISDKSYFYFVHSYYCVPEKEELVLAESDYQHTFVSAVSRDNVFGVQFHPEKSSIQGLKLLNNFGEICYGNNTSNRSEG